MENKENKGKVFVGISGGVDSAVSVALLKEQGFQVVGVFIRTWHPDFIECTEEEERRDAMRVCAHLDVPFLTFDFEDVYKKEVAEYLIREYKIGQTPNPDVMCNREVKFGAFLKKAIEMGADYVATGHYAQTKNNKMLKGIDPAKDQSYFLWTITRGQIPRIIFPVGSLKKSEVRKLAKKYKLPVAEKKDSQGICFLGAIDLKDFLKHYIKEKNGKVLNEKGEDIGTHEGVTFYTLGERHGFVITRKTPGDKPYYIVGKDVKKNVLYVSQDRSYSQNGSKNFLLRNTNWISEIPKEGDGYTCQIRYHGEYLPCQIKIQKSNKAKIILEKRIIIAGGQSCVLYNGDVCLGGGIVV